MPIPLGEHSSRAGILPAPTYIETGKMPAPTYIETGKMPVLQRASCQFYNGQDAHSTG
ncbi:MAG: hypothetical protein F6K26_41460 [Moorea sp. SIO2I5]|nr:hypothetical protein [Moorena sp. SIO2I5]